MEPEKVLSIQVQHQEEESGFDIYSEFVNSVKNGTKEEVIKYLSLIKNTTDTAKRATEDNEDNTSNTLRLSQKLLEALERKDAGDVLKLIVEAKENDVKTLDNLNEVCQFVADNERLKEKPLLERLKSFCTCRKLRSQLNCTCERKSRSNCRENEQPPPEIQNQEEQEWIKVLTDPLYISLEWLWRNHRKGETGAKESTRQDVIEASLRDAHLLEKIASYEHHYSRDEYTKRAEEYEKFAADVVEESNLEQLHVIMDVEGAGCLLKKRPKDFNKSLSLLKIAADKQRKRFVASPKCQYILNEIVYFEWPHWQNMRRTPKIAWSIWQLIIVTVASAIYIPFRLAGKFRCCDKDDESCCKKCLRELYEHPYSKFVNHTMGYLVFLAFVIATSFDEEFATIKTGLVSIDWVVFAFVIGLLGQEVMACWRQNVYNYMSKWWNVVDVVIIITFLAAYIVWLGTWEYSEQKWKPQVPGFVVADVMYASATVLAFFHLTHIFQIDSSLGPLQLSLYKMLKDVWRFLVIFLLLYISFATGTVKVYSYYVASQIELKAQNMSHHQQDHPYAKHVNAFIDLFWLLLGLVEEEKIAVEDPDFHLTAVFGRLFFTVYVICMVIVGLNMLIAMMNNSFDRIMGNADIEWKFSRAQMWLEAIDKGNTMPVPLNIPYYLLYLIVCVPYRLYQIKCQCCDKQGDEEELGNKKNEKGDQTEIENERRQETMKDLVVKYLKHHYFGKDELENDSHDDAAETGDATIKRGKAPSNIQDNINLLRRLVDRQVKELSELNKRLDSIAKATVAS